MTTTAEPNPVTIDYGCPDWCESTHRSDEVVGHQYVTHDGPSFGLVRIEGESGGCLGHNSLGDLDDLTPDELRKLAADLITAAQWLEARA